MHLLPSEQKERIQIAKNTFAIEDELIITDCNCFQPWAGDFGKKEIHRVVTLRADEDRVFVNDGTCKANEIKNWKICSCPDRVIETNTDLL